MPNTMVHVGVQGLATRGVIRTVDLKWVYLGCIIPDVPWIVRRIVQAVLPTVDPYALRAYAIVQSSLLVCLVLCAALALLSSRFWKIYLVLAVNAALHLVLDAMQTKWGNGVHFFAPVSWTLTNWGFFWPESLITYLFTALGLIFIFWHWRSSVRQKLILTLPGIERAAGILLLATAYLLLPLLLIGGPTEANSHYLSTLCNSESRAGTYVECDRASYFETEAGEFLKCWDGKALAVRGVSLGRSVTVSVRGVFLDDHVLVVNHLYVHRWYRDTASILGLMLIAGVWINAWWLSWKVNAGGQRPQ